MNQPSESPMDQPSFPLFKPAIERPGDDAVFSVSDVLHREVMRAALDGPDADAVRRQRISLDVDHNTLDALHALGVALGSTRRAMATKLLEGAVWEAVNGLARAAADDRAHEYAAVLDVFQTAWDQRRSLRARGEG